MGICVDDSDEISIWNEKLYHEQRTGIETIQKIVYDVSTDKN